jgi:hypothetical protein
VLVYLGRGGERQQQLTDHSKGRLLTFIQQAQLLAKDADRPRENAVQTGAAVELPAVLGRGFVVVCLLLIYAGARFLRYLLLLGCCAGGGAVDACSAGTAADRP